MTAQVLLQVTPVSDRATRYFASLDGPAVQMDYTPGFDVFRFEHPTNPKGILFNASEIRFPHE